MKFRKLLVVPLSLLLAATALADFRYDETTRITGGTIVGMMKMAGAISREARQATEPVTSTVMVKDNRMVRSNSDRTEIIDLDKETITHIDHQRQQYSVTTFQQMKQRMEEAQRRLQKRDKTQGDPPQMNFTVHVRNTGAKKKVAGLMASEAILTMAMEATDQKSGQKGALAITNDMWMAPETPGYGEVREFNRRMVLKMGTVLGGSVPPNLAAMQPGAGQGMAELVKEMSKLKGVPVMQVMRMGTTVNGQPLPAASEAALPPPQQGPAMPSAGDVAERSATSAIAGRLGGLGGLGGLGRRKKADAPAEESAPADAPQAGATSAVLMESTTEMTGFASGFVDPVRFAVPVGYKEVQEGRR